MQLAHLGWYYLDIVQIELRICRHNRYLLDDRLCYEQSVKWIVVVKWQVRSL